MERTKFCCEGQNATLIMGLWPITRRGLKFFTALYQCKKCKEVTLRGETNQVASYNTLVEFPTPEDVEELKTIKEHKKSHV